MATQSSKVETVLIDSIPLLSTCLKGLIDLIIHTSNSPLLYINLEGINLGRHGSISILQLYAPLQKRIYIIDVHKLGAKAFAAVDNSGFSLKYILESPVIQKGIFDVRNDSDALFSLYGISVDGIHDIQLMELGTRQHLKAFLAGLAKCVEKECPISAEEKQAWQITKRKVHRLFDPTLGGRYEIFNDRPIKPEILQYCAQDVFLLPGLYEVYRQKLTYPGNQFWDMEVKIATRSRIQLSQSPDFNGHTQENARGPWTDDYIRQARYNWDAEIMANSSHARGGCWPWGSQYVQQPYVQQPYIQQLYTQRPYYYWYPQPMARSLYGYWC